VDGAPVVDATAGPGGVDPLVIHRVFTGTGV
jgi:hypothetical protein